MAELSDLELLAELGVDTAPEPVRTLTPLQERIIAGFEDIQRFVKENGRLPQHGEDRDLFERLYAVRLERMPVLPEARDILARMASEGHLAAAEPVGRVSSKIHDSAVSA